MMDYFEMFSGIGGFTLGIGNLANCVGYSEIDKYAIQIYQNHFPNHKNYGDATKIIASELPNFDLLVGGFPCQSFSIAGKRGGFKDTRGTLFFDIARIVKEKRPTLLLLENVKGLLNHDKGNTFATIISTLDELGYDCQWSVLNSKNFGVPQNRERVFIIGHLRGTKRPNIFPLEKHEHTNIEKVYLLSSEFSKKHRELFSELSQSKEGFLLGEQMQTLLSEVSTGVQEGTCREIPREAESLDTNSEGSLQIIEELQSWMESADKSGGICGVVQVPTEEMLLLWARGESSSISFRYDKQQNLSFECGQNRYKEAIRDGKFGTMLFAVQSCEGRLFYSIGNGRDWQKIYSKTLEKWNNTLGSILEAHPDPKYFLSELATKNLLEKQSSKGARIHSLEGVQEEQIGEEII